MHACRRVFLIQEQLGIQTSKKKKEKAERAILLLQQLKYVLIKGATSPDKRGSD